MNVLIIDDEKVPRECASAAVEATGHQALPADSAKVALQRLQEDKVDLVLLDVDLGGTSGLELLEQIQQRWPRLPVIIATAHATIQSAVEAMRHGAFDYLEKPFSADQLRQRLARVQRAQQMESRLHELERQITARSPEPVFESMDEAMKRVHDIAFRAAATPASILLLGESGTGKSMMAKAIHQRSAVQDQPFVTVNCPSLSKELLESELFGHIKGAFTGALRDTWGKVQAASGGTLFLDEIGELPLSIQPKLLRLLQEREYERVGENKTRTANVRVIAASNRNLKELVAHGEFREDLFYRLNVISVELPPLRSRPADLIHFAESYLTFFSHQFRCRPSRFSEKALEHLRNYQWPGNLRELRNAIERAVILAGGEEIAPSDLPLKAGDEKSATSRVRVGSTVSLQELETEHIRRVLSYSRSLNQAAKILGIDKTTLYRKRKRFEHGGLQESPQSEESLSP